MTPAVKAGCLGIGAHLAMYAWWIWADALLSDDYYMFATAPNFNLQASGMFRPLGAIAADVLTAWLQASPNAVFWAKGLSLALSSAFVGFLAASFARVAGSVGVGVALALLVSTNPGNQINSIWLCTLPIWITYAVASAAFYAVVAARDWHFASRWGLAAALSAAIATMLLIYQMAPFVLAGAAAAYIVLSRDDRQSVARVILPVGMIIVVSMGAYLAALWYASSSGLIESGRASGALGGMLARLGSVQPEQGMFWFNLFLTAPQSAIIVLLITITGASIDIWRNGGERMLRWVAAALLTLAALAAPGALNEFQAARLYAPGSIGVAGLLVAAIVAVLRELPQQIHAGARAVVLALGVALGIASQAAGVIGLGLNQHAELQYVRNQVVQFDATSLVRVHLIPPPTGSAFWTQPIGDPAHDVYTVRLSSYHPWTREGLVRFALRYVDPERRIAVTIGTEPPAPAPGLATVDMRPADRALFQVPF